MMKRLMLIPFAFFFSLPGSPLLFLFLADTIKNIITELTLQFHEFSNYLKAFGDETLSALLCKGQS